MESTAEQNRAIDIQHVGGSASPAELDATPTARRSGDLSLATTPNQVLAIVSVGMILANLDLFVVNVALPNIALDFANPSLGRLSCILNGYTIAYAALFGIFWTFVRALSTQCKLPRRDRGLYRSFSRVRGCHRY
jgi:hypothetical protein